MGLQRGTFQALLNDLPTVFPDNVAGQITPAVLRDYLSRFIQSAFLPDARLVRSTAGFAMPLTATFAAVPIALYQTADFDASGDVSADILTGRCLTNPTVPNLSYIPGAQITGEGAINTQFDFSFGLNGAVPTIVLGSMTTQGAGRDVNIQMSELFNSIPANAFVELFARAPAGAATLTISYARFQLVGWQTWD